MSHAGGGEDNPTPSSAGRGRRPNKPIVRLTYPTLGNAADVVDPGVLHTNREETSSWGDGAASVRSSSTVKRAQAEVVAKKKILEIKNKLRKAETLVAHLKIELDDIEDELKDVEGDPEAKPDEIKRLKATARDLKKRMKAAQLEVDTLKQTTADEIDIVNEEKRVDLEEIEEEDGQFADADNYEKYDGDEHQDDAPDPTAPPVVNRTDAWVATQAATATASKTPSNPTAQAPPPEDKPITARDLVAAMQQLAAPRTSSYGDKELPVFSGKPEEWIGFLAQYERTTKDYRLTDSDNLHRLRKCLKGRAMEAVTFLFNTPDNVDEILKTLQFEFGRPELIIKALIRNVESTPKPDLAKPDTVVTFARAVQSLVATIKSHKQQGYLDSAYLLEKLQERLPVSMQRGWQRYLLENPWKKESLDTFQEYMGLEKQMACKLTTLAPGKNEDKSEQKRKRGPGAVNTTTSTSKDLKCFCCEEAGHSLQKCDVFAKKAMDDRWKFVREKQMCISCLGGKHKARDCKSAKTCPMEGCDFKHHKLLHGKREKRETSPPLRNEEHVPVEGEAISARANFVSGCDGPLPIVPIKIKGADGVLHNVYALLDGGSSTSLIRRSLADKLQLGLGNKSFSYTINGVTGDETDDEARRVEFKVAGAYRGSDFGVVRGAVAVKTLPTFPYSIDVEKIKEKWPHLRNVPAKSLNFAIPDVLIGNNNPHLILPRRLVMGKDTEPWGWRTPLGWTISGNFYSSSGSVNAVYGGGYPTNEYLHNLIKSSFSIDDLGVKVTTSRGINIEERRALDILDSTAKKNGDAWECGLLWREDEVSFADSEFAAIDRLERMERKLKDQAFKQAYNSKIAEYCSKGYATKLSEEEAATRRPSTYIIPTFGVFNPNKPGKFRLVMDAKSKNHGVSLNDKLLKGPDLIRPLTAVLWNFRRHPIALTGDIADMFHRVKVREEDRDSQRFLWRDADSRRKPAHYRMEVLIFGATSSPASAIYIKNKNADTFAEMYPAAAKVITSDFYVDDCLTGGKTEEEVITLRRHISDICQAGNFQVCKWLSNSPAVLSSIPEELKAEGAKGLVDKEDLEGERVLGLWWEPVSDTFQFRLGLHKVKKCILDGEVPTKREMCGLIMSLFDPLGFIAHFKIKGQILLQQVWSSGVSWDDEIPMEVYAKWKLWVDRIPELSRVTISRCYFSSISDPENTQLHVFVDASTEAYSAVAYLRMKRGDNVSVSFVCGKSRVAPLKKVTIPRLELLAALMGTRLSVKIGEELDLKITSRYFWSDSSTVLQWLRSPAAKLKEFVANRIGEIQESTNIAEWNWVPTKINVADLATRWESEISFTPESTWFTGPAFLLAPESTWKFEEQRKTAAVLEEGYVNVTIAKKKCPAVAVPEPSRFSSFMRLQRATAGLLRIYRYLRNPAIGKPWHRPPDGSLLSRIEPQDMQNAEKLLCKFAQEESFPIDLAALREGKVVNSNGQLSKLSPVLEDDLLRMDARISRVDGVPEETKRPIILPSHHPVTDLLIDQEHARNAHQGHKTIITNLQQKFWIVRSGHAVNRSFARCWTCKLRRLKPVSPRMAALPRFRLAHHEPAFTYCGIDLFGPLTVTVGRHHEKRWGVVICCMTTRAVYLDIVYDLTADELIMAIDRFIATRMRPSMIVCDNGTNLVGSARKLGEAWASIDLEKIRAYGPFKEIEWLFNPASAPHMGGVWEILVKLAKKCLFAVLHEKAPKDSTLLTALKGAENILNSRPITAISDDPADPTPLTPNHFIRGICDVGPGVPAGTDGAKVLRESWKRSLQLQEIFWQRWTREFLPKLMRREKWHEAVEPIQVGALVVVMEDNAPMNCWKRGYVSRVFPSVDGQVRSVEVTTRDFATKKTSIFKRPVVKLCQLGLQVEIKDPKAP